MQETAAVQLRVKPDQSCVVDGFSCIPARISPSFFHLTLLPNNESPNLLLSVAGPARQFDTPPVRSVITFDQTKPFKNFPTTPEPSSRREKLTNLCKDLNCHLLGDLTKDACCGSAVQSEKLTGRRGNGVTVGLERRSECGEWKGDYLDSNPILIGDGEIWHVPEFCTFGHRSPELEQ